MKVNISFCGLILGLLLTFSSNVFAVSQLKVICDIDGGKIYVDGKFKSTCYADEPIFIIIPAGRHKIEAKKYNKDGSYYYFSKVVEVGDGVRVTITVNSEEKYTEKYYWYKAKKRGNPQDYWAYLKKFPHGRFASRVKSWIDNFYWQECQLCKSLNSCDDYLKKVPWGKRKKEASEMREVCYLRQERPDVYWQYLKRFPNGKFVGRVKDWLENYYYNACVKENSYKACKTYISNISWGNRRKDIRKKIDFLLCKSAENKGMEALEKYILQHPNSVCANQDEKKKIMRYFINHCNLKCLLDHIEKLGFHVQVKELNLMDELKKFVNWDEVVIEKGRIFGHKGKIMVYVHARLDMDSLRYTYVDVLFSLNKNLDVIKVKYFNDHDLNLASHAFLNVVKDEDGGFVKLTGNELVKYDSKGKEMFSVQYANSIKSVINEPKLVRFYRKTIFPLGNYTYAFLGDFSDISEFESGILFAKFKVKRGFLWWDLEIPYHTFIPVAPSHKFRTGDESIIYSFLLKGNRIYILTHIPSTNYVVEVDPYSGKVLQRIRLLDDKILHNILLTYGKGFIVAESDDLYRLNSKGDKIWKLTFDEALESAYIDENNNLFVLESSVTSLKVVKIPADFLKLLDSWSK